MKIRQQKELSESIIAKIQKELENPKVLQQILQQSVIDVESKYPGPSRRNEDTNMNHRDRFFQGSIDDSQKGWNIRRFPFITPCL